MFARSIRTTFAVALLALSVVPATAFADGSAPRTGAETSRGVRQDKREKESFPMPAADFKTKVENRIVKAREHLTTSLGKHDVPAPKQKEILAKFDAGAVKVRAELEKVCADGTVTKEEAHAVRELARELRGNKGHKSHDKDKEAKNDKKGQARG